MGRLQIEGLLEADRPVRELFSEALRHGERDEWDSAVRLLEEAIQSASESQAVALHGLAGMSCYLDGSLGRALEHFEDAARLAGQRHDEQAQADSLLNSGIILRERSEPAKAQKVFEAALAIYRQLGLRRAEADALLNLGFLRQLTEAGDQAHSLYVGALAIYRSIGQDWGTGSTLTRLGNLHAARGELRLAVQKYLDALLAFAEVSDANAPGPLIAALHTTYQRLGHDGFVTACKSAGWSEDHALKLIEEVAPGCSTPG